MLNSQPDEEERQSLVNRQLNFNQPLGAGTEGDGLLRPQPVVKSGGALGSEWAYQVNMNRILDSSMVDMNDARIRQKFPKMDRFQLAMCACYNQETPIDRIRKMPPLFKFEEQFKDEKFRKMAIRLKICETGSLVLDHFMIHPFVRVHIVDMRTHKYLAKSDSAKPGVNNKESAGFIDTNKNITKQ